MMNDEEINALVKDMFDEALAAVDEDYAKCRPDAPAREGWACGPSDSRDPFIDVVGRCGISKERSSNGRIDIFANELQYMVTFAVATGMFAACADLVLMAQNPLASALLEGDAGLAAKLLDGGADPDKPVCGRPPLCIAASEGCIKALLERGARAECETVDGVTALECALFRGLAGGAALLLKAGADPYGTDGGAVALAARFGMLDVLTDAGADLNHVYANGVPVAYDAFCNLDRETCRRLLEAGVEAAPDGADDTLMHGAASAGNGWALELLLASGVDPDLRDPAGCTPLFNAVRFPNIVEMLIKGGAAVDARDDEDSAPLMEAVWYPESLKLLLAAGADVDAADEDGWTALHHAAVGGSRDGSYEPSNDDMLESARILIEAGIDLDAANSAGETAEDIAENDDNPECARLIREARRKRGSGNRKTKNRKKR